MDHGQGAAKGNNLGSSQGASSVTVGGVPAAFVYYWGNADGSKAAGPSDLFAYHKMQTIAFSVPSGAPDMGWNYLVNVRARFGLHVYDETACGDFVGTTKIHDNVVKDQASAGIHLAALSSHTSTCITNPVDVWNNLLIDTGKDPDGKGWDQVAIEIQGAYLTSHARLYNNTVYGYGNGAGTGEGLLIQKSGDPTWGFNGSFEWVNNIVFDVHGSPYQDPSLSTTPMARGHNLWYSSAGNPVIPSWDTNPLHSDPLFTDAGAGDFSLQSNSPAKGAGAAGLYPYSILGDSGASYDVGAF